LYTFEKLVLPDRIELSTSPLPRECSTTELRQRIRKYPMFSRTLEIFLILSTVGKTSSSRPA
jgi:hypothetical protein